jgi:hypothetical protein
MVYKDTFIFTATNKTPQMHQFMPTKSVDDQVTRAETLFSNFVAEHNLPFTVSDHFTGVLLVAVTAFLCNLVSECLLISYSPPEATLKLEVHRVQHARRFPNELDFNQWCDFFHSSWNLQMYFFFFDVEEGVLGPEYFRQSSRCFASIFIEFL